MVGTPILNMKGLEDRWGSRIFISHMVNKKYNPALRPCSHMTIADHTLSSQDSSTTRHPGSHISPSLSFIIQATCKDMITYFLLLAVQETTNYTSNGVLCPREHARTVCQIPTPPSNDGFGRLDHAFIESD